MIVLSDEPVGLVGGGPISVTEFNTLRAIVPRMVAADGGALVLHARGIMPEAVIGDLDSLPDVVLSDYAGRIHRIAEQETVDFEKVIQRVQSPLMVGVGFLGGRMDHTMATMNVLVRHASRPIFLLSDVDVFFALNQGLHEMELEPGTRLSILPMAETGISATGLAWPLEKAVLSPDAMISVSNKVIGSGKVRIETDAPVLITLPLAAHGAVMAEYAQGGVRAG